ncbi:MAG: DUF3592 domain-containing protein [Anaerolineales bacterium]|nr:DUF3592 domain-containing protein [Anaerolineales bacterium]
MKTCPRCGAEIQNPSLPTCAYCGAVLGNEQKQRTPPTPYRSPIATTPLAPTPGTLPPEYSHLKRPKPVASLESAGCLIIFGLIWTVFSAFMVIAVVGSFSRDYLEYFQLSRQGVITQATVTWLETRESDDSTSYHVFYKYMGTANNENAEIEDSDSISSSLYASLKIEQKIEILYVPTNPAISAVRAELASPNPMGFLFMVGIGGLFVLIGVGLLYAGGKTQKQLGQLRAEGLQTQGLLFDRWTDKDSDGDTTYYVAFAFTVRARAGDPIITRAEQNKKLYDKYRIGDTLSIRYLPNDPSVCMVQVPP